MSFTLTEKKFIDLVQAFHAANYPTTEVNFPGRTVTDVEYAADPFVFVEWAMRERTHGMPTQVYSIEGELLLHHYARINSGSKIFSDYSTALGVYLSRKTIDSVEFYDLTPYQDFGKPGFDGMSNVIRYEVQYSR